MIGIAAAVVLIVGPSLYGLAGLIRGDSAPAGAGSDLPVRVTWRLTVVSALLYVLAFNLTSSAALLFTILPSSHASRSGCTSKVHLAACLAG